MIPRGIPPSKAIVFLAALKGLPNARKTRTTRDEVDHHDHEDGKLTVFHFMTVRRSPWAAPSILATTAFGRTRRGEARRSPRCSGGLGRHAGALLQERHWKRAGREGEESSQSKHTPWATSMPPRRGLSSRLSNGEGPSSPQAQGMQPVASVCLNDKSYTRGSRFQ